jgi:SOS-response transcriptional repressor LexA
VKSNVSEEKNMASNPKEIPVREFRRIRPLSGGKPSDRFYCARIAGESMADDGIFNNDIVIIKTTFNPDELAPGRLVAAQTPYGLLVKRAYVSLNGKIRLVSASPLYQDIVLDPEQCEIQGIAVRVERDLELESEAPVHTGYLN